jgi:hypothetical protein
VITVDCPVPSDVARGRRLESIGRGGASDGDASDAFDACFRARRAYWTASNAACGASSEEHRSVWCELN